MNERIAERLGRAFVFLAVGVPLFFSCWMAGGRLVLIAEELRYDPAGLLEVMERAGVERLFMPAVALQQLAEVADARGVVPSRLREVQTAGEQLRVTEPMRRCPDVQ